MNLKNKKILSLCGGGVKGLAHLSALKVLEENEVLQNIEIYAGTSIGAIIVALVIVGYSIQELYDFTIALDLKKLFNIDDFSTLISNYGFDKGTRIDYIIKNLLMQKGLKPDITLFELYEKTGKHLVITATNLNTGKGEYLDYITEPNMPLKLAMRISSCVPILCVPIQYNDSLYVDGGCTIPIPLDIFKNRIDEVLAIDFITPNKNVTINNLEDYISTVFKTFYNNMTSNNSKFNIIKIEIDIVFVDFTIDAEKKKNIYDTSYKKALGVFGFANKLPVDNAHETESKIEKENNNNTNNK